MPKEEGYLRYRTQLAIRQTEFWSFQIHSNYPHKMDTTGITQTSIYLNVLSIETAMGAWYFLIGPS